MIAQRCLLKHFGNRFSLENLIYFLVWMTLLENREELLESSSLEVRGNRPSTKNKVAYYIWHPPYDT